MTDRTMRQTKDVAKVEPDSLARRQMFANVVGHNLEVRADTSRKCHLETVHLFLPYFRSNVVLQNFLCVARE